MSATPRPRFSRSAAPVDGGAPRTHETAGQGPPSGRRRRGVAVVMVLVVLAALFLIAVPFLLSTGHEEAAARSVTDRMRARRAAESAATHAAVYLRQSHETVERAGGGFATPFFDDRGELWFDDGAPFRDLSRLLSGGSARRGSLLLSVVGEDESAKINLNTATPWVLGNLIGSAMLAHGLAEDTRPGAHVAVDSVETLEAEGLLWVHSGSRLPLGNGRSAPAEVIAYRVTPERDEHDHPELEILERAVVQSAEFGPPRAHPPGTLAVDLRAYKIAMTTTADFFGADDGDLVLFDTVGEVKRIALFDLLPSGDFAEREALTPRQYRILARHTTVSSGRSDGNVWVNLQTVRAMRTDPDDPLYPTRVNVADSTRYSAGTVLRVIGRAQTRFARLARRTRGGNDLILDRRLSVLDPYEGVIETLQRHPVNLNTAEAPVLFALFYGLRGDKAVISRPLAWQIANAVLSRARNVGGTPGPFVDEQDFIAFIQGLGLAGFDAEHARLLLLNAHSPEHGQLWIGSMPFSLVSSDVYRLRAFAAVSNAAGDHTASHQLSRVVQIGPPGDDEWPVYRFEDFDRSSRLPVLNLTKVDGSTSQGFVRLRISEQKDQGDGQAASGATMTAPLDLTQSGSVQFWAKTPQTPAADLPVFLMDVGDGDFRNRMSLFYHPQVVNPDASSGALMLRMADDTLERSFYEYRYPLEPGSPMLLKPDTWYHFQPIWGALQRQGDKEPVTNTQGAQSRLNPHRFRQEFWDQAAIGLLIDGQPSFANQGYAGYVQITHYDDAGVPWPLSARLAVALDEPARDPQAGMDMHGLNPHVTNPPNQLQFIGNAPPWCALAGAPAAPVRIGNEVVIVDPNARILQRGARRQPWDRSREPQDHPADALVVPWGYRERVVRHRIPRGNGVLRSALTTDILGEVVSQTMHPAAQVPGLDESALAVTLTNASGFQDSGWVLVFGYGVTPGWTVPPPRPPPAPSYTAEEELEMACTPYSEIVYYTRKAGNTLALEARPTPHFFRSGWTFVAPLSLEVAPGPGALDYDDPQIDNTTIGVLQIIEEDAGRDFEWVVYERIDQDHAPAWHFVHDTRGQAIAGAGAFLTRNERRAALAAKDLPRGRLGSQGNSLSTVDQLDRLVIGDVTTMDDTTRQTLWRTVKQSSWRAQYGTGILTHRQGKLVLPVFRTEGKLAGRFDPITLVDDRGQNPETQVINHTRELTEDLWRTQNIPKLYNHYLLAAFRRFVGTDSGVSEYPIGSWLLKFPIGTLPGQIGGAAPTNFAFGRQAATMTGPETRLNWQVDLQETGHQNTGYVQHAAVPEAQSLTRVDMIPVPLGRHVNSADGADASLFPPRPNGQQRFGPGNSPEAALVFVEDEVFAYAALDGARSLRRAWRGSAITGHDRGVLGLVTPPSMRPVSALDGDDGLALTLVDARTFNRAGDAGGVVFVEESAARESVIAYTELHGNELFVPAANPGQADMFRGCFGTPVLRHQRGALVFDWPFRYSDVYAPLQNRPEMVYYQTAFSRTNALWLELQVAFENTGAVRDLLGSRYYDDPRDTSGDEARAQIVCRVGGDPPWDDPDVIVAPRPAEQGKLFRCPYDFLDENAKIPRGEETTNFDRTQVFALELKGDTLEIRVYFPQPTDAFFRDAWKWTPRLKRLTAVFRQRNQVLAQWEER